MTAEFISESYPVSRKDRYCMACDWLLNGDTPIDKMTFAERRSIVLAKRNKWRIKAGEKYLKRIGKCCGDFGAFIAIPAIDEICSKYDLYEDVC